jgi:hypothetical protein
MYTRFPSLIVKTGSAGGGSYDSDAQAFFTGANITDTTEKNAWNTFVNSAKISGYYSKFYFFYPFLGSDANKTKYNAINTSQYTITWTGSITHDSMGVKATAGNSTASTGFNPDGNFFYNTAHIGYYLNFASLDSSIVLDLTMADSNLVNCIYFQYIQGNWYRANTLNNTYGNAYITTANGLYALNTEYDSGASLWRYKAYTNGSVTETFQGNNTEDSTGATGLNLFYYYIATYYSLANLRCAYAAQGFTASEMTAFNTHLQTFMTALGRNL